MQSTEVAERWKAAYQELLDCPPQPDDILKCIGCELARLDIEIVEGKAPFIYGRAYIPCVVGQPTGWFLQPLSSDTAHGWKCILLPKARDACIRARGLKHSKVGVHSLRVVRVSESGKSLLCEIAQFDLDGEEQ